MTPQDTDTLADAPKILSDEEMRSRAAASAQQLYESQLEAYRAQREQLLEVQRVRAEYERCRAAYEEACRAYRESKNRVAASAVVRVDPDTGEQIVAPANTDSAFVPEEFENVPVPENSAENFAPENVPAPAEETESVPAIEEAPVPVPAEEAPAPAEAPVSPKRASRRVRAARFPLVAVIILIFFAAEFSAFGYIMFSGDPRFDGLRERVRSMVSSIVAPEESAVPAIEADVSVEP